MFTSSALSTPRFTRDRSGCGSPKSTSETSVAIIEPPQPSASAVRDGRHEDVLGVVVDAHVRDVQAGDHLAVDAARRGVGRGPVLLLLLGRAADVHQHRRPACRTRASSRFGHVLGHLAVAAAVAGDAVFLGQGAEPLRAADLVGFRGRPRRPAAGRGRSRGRGRSARPCPRRCAAAGSARRSSRPPAPQMPSCAPLPPGLTRHGPMKQFRQQSPSLPKLHCGLLRLEPVPDGRDPRLVRQNDHLLRGRIDRIAA